MAYHNICTFVYFSVKLLEDDHEERVGIHWTTFDSSLHCPSTYSNLFIYGERHICQGGEKP